MPTYADTIITTTRLRLVPVSNTFAQDIFENITSDITTYMFPKAAETINETLAFIDDSRVLMETGEALTVAILNGVTGEFIGGAGIKNANTRAPELGIWVKASAHGHKFGREAVHGLKNWAQSNLAYEYLIYPFDQANVGSRKIAESLGGTAQKEYPKVNLSGRTLNIVEYWIPKQ